MKKIIIPLLIIIFSSPLFAATNPTVSLQTKSLGYPYAEPFTINVMFSEPVIGFDATKVNVTNGSVTNVTGAACQPNFSVTIQPSILGAITMVIPANGVVSVSTGAYNLASNTLTIAELSPALPPASNFDLRQWNLTLPIPIGSTSGNAVSIGQVTLNGTPSINNGYSNPPYFFTDPTTGAMNFAVPLNGATTPGSDFARCELTEILPGASPTWRLNTFISNTLLASVLITRVPPTEKRFVIGQIHGKGNRDIYGHSVSNSPLLKLYYDANPLDPNNKPCNGCIYAQIRTTPSQSNFLTIVNLIQNIPLNTLFTYQLNLLKNGTLTVTANNTSTVIRLNTSTNNIQGWGAQQLYFKAGAYNLEHDSVAGGAVSFYFLQVSHT